VEYVATEEELGRCVGIVGVTWQSGLKRRAGGPRSTVSQVHIQSAWSIIAGASLRCRYSPDVPILPAQISQISTKEAIG
jgi:hypothetical protein